MKGPVRFVAIGLLGSLGAAAPAGAYHRLRFGPFELVPSLQVEVRQHSNIYVVTDRQAENNANAEVGGILFNVRPGLNLSVKPKLEKHIRGLYLDARYQPTMSLFPSAPQLTCEERGIPSPCPSVDDSVKIDHHLFTGIRYQVSSALTFSAGYDFSQPELSQSNLHLTDEEARLGVKYDFNRRLSIEGSADWKRFHNPTDLTPPGSVELITADSPFGSFDSPGYEARLWFQWSPTVNIGATYDRTNRQFVGVPLQPPCASANPRDCPTDPNDLDRDGIPDNSKDYVQHEYHATLQKRLTRTARGGVSVGRSVRNNDERQFGAKDYALWSGSVTMETLLSQRTRLQFAAEQTLTDTVREITITELNAFTNDQTGQFAVLPEQFSASKNQRVVVDLIQNIFKRGDQILFGVAWQRDELMDQLGGQNRFLPPDASGSINRNLDSSECEAVSADGTGFFCRTTLDNQLDHKFLVTAGYRLRVKRWLGIQMRGGYFTGRSAPQLTAAVQEDRPEREPREGDDTHYWTLSGGMVVNLQVFHE